MRQILALLAILLVSSTFASGQNCLDADPQQVIYGRVIVPIPGFDQTVEVILYDITQDHIFTYTKGGGDYQFSPVSPGRFEVVVRIEGFKEYRARVDACDYRGRNLYNIFIEFDDTIPFMVADFSLELNEAVDLAELGGIYSRHAVDEFRKAQSDRKSGFFKTAEERLQRLVAAVPEFYEAHVLLGSNYLDRRNFRQAEAEFNTASDLKPLSPVPLLGLGSLYLVELQAATHPEPGEVGVIVAEENIPLMLDDARSALEQAVRLKPDAAFAYYLLGVTYHKSSAYTRSETNYKKALELDPKLRWTRIGLANLYLRLGKVKEVVEQLDAYQKDFPGMENRFEVEAMRKRLARLLPAVK